MDWAVCGHRAPRFLRLVGLYASSTEQTNDHSDPTEGITRSPAGSPSAQLMARVRRDELLAAARSAQGLLAFGRSTLVRLGPIGKAPRRYLAREFEEQLATLLYGTVESFASCIACLEGRIVTGVISSYRYISEALALMRWLAEPSTGEERNQRAFGLTEDAMRRISRVEQEFDRAVFMEHTLYHIRNRRATAPVFPPRRADLLRCYLPGGHTVFSWVSELASHPGPLANVALGRGGLDEEDFGWWVSATCGMFVDVLREVASALDQEEWIHELDETVSAADPVIGLAWSKTKHPRAWQEHPSDRASQAESASDPP
jgi:hypothetical protein